MNRFALAPTVLVPLAVTVADVDILATGRIVRFALMLDASAPDSKLEPASVLLGCPDTVADVDSVAVAFLNLVNALTTAPSVVRLAEASTSLPPATLTDACEASVAEAVITPVT